VALMKSPVAIVTGAGRGIGRATALELAGYGYQVVLVARTESDLAQTAGLLVADGALTVAADLSRPADIERAIAAAMDRFGRIDALINNAGYAPVATLEQTTPEEWQKVLDINLTAPFLLTSAVWPVFKKGGGGVIVNVTSVAARDPFPTLAAYGATKAALNLLTLAAAREGQPLGIRVHAVAPAATETGMFRSLMSEEQFPRDRTLDPADVARVIVQCVCGDLRYSSGEVIYMHRTVK